MKKLVTILAALALSACSSFHFDSQEIGLVHDAEEDVLEIEFVYRNVRPSGEKEGDREDYEEVLQRILKGDRFFVLPPLFWDVDWEETASKLTERGEELDEEDRRTLEFVRCLSVVEASLFEDREGRPCLRQKVRLSPASRSMQLLNEGIRAGLLREVEEGGLLETENPDFDLRTRRLWAEEARQGIDWVAWKGKTLTFTMPVSPTSAAHLLEEVMDMSRDFRDMPATSLVVGIIRSLTSIEIRDDHLHLEFAPGDDGQLSADFGGLTWD